VGASACYGRPITRAPRGRSDAREVRRAIDVHVPKHLFRTPCSGSLQHPGVDQPLAEVPTASSIVRSASSGEFVPSSRVAHRSEVYARRPAIVEWQVTEQHFVLHRLQIFTKRGRKPDRVARSTASAPLISRSKLAHFPCVLSRNPSRAMVSVIRR
jgi:hypothetical protein